MTYEDKIKAMQIVYKVINTKISMLDIDNNFNMFAGDFRELVMLTLTSDEIQEVFDYMDKLLTLKKMVSLEIESHLQRTRCDNYEKR